MPRSFFALLIVPLCFTACSSNNVTVDNSLKRYFDSAGVQGSFGFFDNGQGHFTIYNLSRYTDSLYQPGATFDIMQSLVAIQSGVVKDDTAVIHWDAEKLLVVKPDCNDDLTLASAFQNPCDIPFRELARRIGRDSLRKWIDSLQYGNRSMGADSDAFGINPFWSNNSLKINSDQQLGLLKKLYFNQLPFFQRTQQIVCRMMSSENDPGYRLSYKTSRGKKEDGHDIGWIMGWVEENKSPYFFVVNLESADPNKDLGAAGLAITKGILRQLGFSQGKK